TNAEAFPALGCWPDKNRTNPKGRVRSQVLSNPLLGGARARFGKIQSGAGRKPSLCDNRELSYRARNSCAGDLLSRRRRRFDLARRPWGARPLQLSRRKLAGAPRVLRIGSRSNCGASRIARIGLHRDEATFAG